jgi:hypothetical protein
LHAGAHTVASDGYVHVVHRPGLWGSLAHEPAAYGGYQIREPKADETLLLGGHADELSRAAVAGDPGVKSRLHVGMLDSGELLGQDRQLAGVRAEVAGETCHERRVSNLVPLHGPFEEGP